MKRLTITILYLGLMINSLFSRHIIGGEFYYECKGSGPSTNIKSYQFTLTVYRDCSDPAGSPLDPDASFGVYSYNGSRYQYISQLTVNHGPINRINPEINPCVFVPLTVCVEKSNYIFTLDLPVTDETYIVYYMRCCRNSSILNIVEPANTGTTFFIEISPIAQMSCNNSPRFMTFPPIAICSEFPLDFDISSLDIEGDSLVYEFYTPFAGGSAGAGGQDGCSAVRPNPANCAPPFMNVSFISLSFSVNQPMGQGVLNLNPVTGMLRIQGANLGQYIVGIVANEYRNGQLIGRIHRDFQFNVLDCSVLSNTIDLQSDNILLISNLPVNIDPLANDSIRSKSNITVNITEPRMGKLSYSPSTGKGIFTPSSISSSKEVLTYTVCLKDCPSSCKSSTIEIEINIACGDRNNLVLPNILFPTGTGANRYLFVEAIQKCPGAFGPKPHKLEVFNRWGSLVYRNDNYLNDWDGTTTSRQPLPEGTYYYLLDLGSVAAPVRGYVVIMR